MSIKRERTKQGYIIDDSCAAYVDLTALHLCMVTARGGAAVAPGTAMTVTTPGGQGVVVYGNLLNAPDEGETAEIALEGIQEVRANAAFDAGEELTVAGVNGRAEAAASGDFVFGVAREAAGGAGHCISYTVKHYYMP